MTQTVGVMTVPNHLDAIVDVEASRAEDFRQLVESLDIIVGNGYDPKKESSSLSPGVADFVRDHLGYVPDVMLENIAAFESLFNDAHSSLSIVSLSYNHRIQDVRGYLVFVSILGNMVKEMRTGDNYAFSRACELIWARANSDDPDCLIDLSEVTTSMLMSIVGCDRDKRILGSVRDIDVIVERCVGDNSFIAERLN